MTDVRWQMSDGRCLNNKLVLINKNKNEKQKYVSSKI